MQKIIICFFLFMITSLSLKGQTFRLGLLSGFNICKLGGEEKSSYNFLGYKIGGRIGVDLQRQLRVSLDLLYSRKGNIVSQSRSTLEVYKNVRLDYMEVPLLVTFMDWMDDPDEEEYYKLHFTFGMSYSRLVNYRAIDNIDNDVTNQQNFNRTKWSALGGLVYYPTEHLGISLDYAHSLSNLEKDNKLPNVKVRNWSLGMIYMLHNKRIRK